jgi:two-component system, cell cycle sensor histidine kinase and response regulator CckA
MPKQQAVESGIHLNVLVVDDEETIRTFVADLLASKGYNVIAAKTAEEAFELAKEYKEPLHLLLSDIQMPGMTGVELAGQISRKRPEIKVLLMSGLEGGLLALNDGWHFIHKPFIPAQLLGLVKTAIAEPPIPDFGVRK